MKNILFVILFIFLFNCCQKESVTTETLLNEITDRDAIAKLPDPYYTCAQFSSYDRNSVAPDQPGWFDNMDKNQFIRIETNEGRREFVMYDAEGPGAVVRFWTTVAGYKGNGILRIYIDNEEKPVIEGEILKLISGGGLIEEGPLSTSVSDKTTYLERGHNFYFPIAYAKHCKITYESPDIIEPASQSGEGIFYNINYRTYEKGTIVKSFSLNDLTVYADLIKKVNHNLRENTLNLDVPGIKTINISKYIAQNEEITEEISGSKSIRKIVVKLKADSIEQVLRSCVFEMSFDGEQTVWCPVGDFFGVGYKLSPFVTRYTQVESDSSLLTYWVMPFRENCNFKIVNLGRQPVEINADISYADWKWDNNSMHFGASWHQQTGIDTGESPYGDGNDKYDINYGTITGEGVLVGTSVVLFNTANAWWGEGDEKVYVDGESFPSHIGTGTEDYYGYAWGMEASFSHPYIAQPDGSGNQRSGYVSNIRYRGLDAIPFRKSIRFDMEMWHWARTILNHAPATFWYARPGAKSNIDPQPEAAKIDVMLEVPPKQHIIYEKGPIEGENMIPLQQKGFIGTQTIKGIGWSNDTQLMWSQVDAGEELDLSFMMNEQRESNVNLRMTMAHDYGIISIKLNGKTIVPSFDAYSSDLKTASIPCGKNLLEKGENILTVKLLGKNKNAINSYFGLDCIEID